MMVYLVQTQQFVEIRKINRVDNVKLVNSRHVHLFQVYFILFHKRDLLQNQANGKDTRTCGIIQSAYHVFGSLDQY